MRMVFKCWIGIASLFLVGGGIIHAQSLPPGSAGPTASTGVSVPASKDPNDAPEGAYVIDLDHSSVVARVLHRGLSYNVVRFGVSEGALDWNPENPSAIALDVKVNTTPYYAPIVYNILPEGPQFLNVQAFPEARFVSTAVHAADDGRAVVEGSLTLMGVTKPAIINAELVGIGRSIDGTRMIGFTGTMIIDWDDYVAPSAAPSLGRVTVVLDAEFMPR